MRLLDISDDASANAYVTVNYLPEHNARFTVQAASAVDHHRKRDGRIRDDDVFCLEHSRVIGNDYVVQCSSQGLQLDRAARGRVPAKSTVIVRETEDSRLRVIHVGRDGRERVCNWTPAVPRAKPIPQVQQETSVSAAAAAVIAEQAQPNGPKAPPHKPGPDHPWRRQHKEWRELALLRRAGADVHP